MSSVAVHFGQDFQFPYYELTIVNNSFCKDTTFYRESAILGSTPVVSHLQCDNCEYLHF